MMRRRLATTAFVIVLAVASAATGPAAWARDEWFDHYNAAIAALGKDEWARALRELDAAMAKNDTPAYARTYGNYFIAYTPHALAGRAHYELGACEDALAAFARSEAANETEIDPALTTSVRTMRVACEARLSAAQAAPASAAESSIRPPAPERSTTPASAKPPLPVPPALDRALLERGLAAYLAGDLDAAVQSFERLVTQSPRSPGARLLLATALHGAWTATGGNDDVLLNRAREAARQAKSLDPGLAPDSSIYPPPVVALFRDAR